MKANLEKILYDRNHSFGYFDFLMPRFQCPFHHHPELELTLIVSSTGQRYGGGPGGRFAPGDLVLMGPNLPHMYINEVRHSGPAHSRVLQFLPDCLGAGFFQLRELKAVRVLLERSRVGLSFYGETRDRVAALMAGP